MVERQITPKNLVWSISKANSRGLYRLISPCPCATQNELDVDAAHQLIANGVKAVAEGQICRPPSKRSQLFQQAGVLFAPGKAANAGGVATSGLKWHKTLRAWAGKPRKLTHVSHHIMLDIHHACVEHGGEGEQTNYVQGVNIAGFCEGC
ncbi:hypothetical protein ACULNC_14190 [Shigella flexneri]